MHGFPETGVAALHPLTRLLQGLDLWRAGVLVVAVVLAVPVLAVIGFLSLTAMESEAKAVSPR